jgi:hypothetical protein
MDTSDAGRLGAAARNDALSPEQRSEAARRAVKARWNKFYRENPTKRKKKAKAGK